MSTLTLPPALARRAAAGALAHAYILSARDPEALQNAARGVAAAMVCQGETPPCGACKPCQKAAKGVHPDVVTVEKREDKREIVVDQVRFLRSDAYVRPNEGKRKVYLIRDAHLMNAEAQNAFLKVLEDGPAYAAFLLLTPTPDMLLPTVRSRCETIRVDTQEAADPELDRRAGELAALLLAGDHWALMAWCAGHEKDKRDEAAALLEEGRKELLRRRNETNTPQAVRLAGVLGELKTQLDGNGNVGCALGRLWAEASEDA